MMRRFLNRKGQSTLEYVIIWTAIIAAILIGANSFLKPAVEGAIDTTSTKIGAEVEALTTGLAESTTP